MENIELIVGKKVKERRLALRMSQEDLAKKAKTSLTTINRLEKGRQYPRYETLADIAKALGISASDLLSVGETTLSPLKISASSAELILAIQLRLTSLDKDQLARVATFIDDLLSRQNASATGAKSAVGNE